MAFVERVFHLELPSLHASAREVDGGVRLVIDDSEVYHHDDLDKLASELHEIAELMRDEANPEDGDVYGLTTAPPLQATKCKCPDCPRSVSDNRGEPPDWVERSTIRPTFADL